MNSHYNQLLTSLRQRYAPLSELSDSQLEQLFKPCYLYDGDALTVVEQSRCLFVLQGTVELSEAGGKQYQISATDLSVRPHCMEHESLSLRASTDVVLAWYDPERLDFLMGWVGVRNQSTTSNELADWLDSIKSPLIFKRLPLENAQAVFDRLENIEVSAGDEVVTQGEPGDYFYLIKAGVAEVWQKGLYDTDQKRVATLSAGQHFGEEALVLSGSRNATVRMQSDGVLQRLNKDSFDELIHSPMIKRVSASVAKAMLDDSAVLLDVRYPEEFEMEYIEGATLLPLYELRERISELAQDVPLVVHCHGGGRSDVATMLLTQNGFNAVSVLGGIRDWPYDIVHPE